MSRLFRRLRYLAHPLIRQIVGYKEGRHLIRRSRQPCYPEASFSLHMLTCHADLDMSLWCLRTFTQFSELSPAITIHDDGSLTMRDKRLLQRVLRRCRVIDRADADQKLDRALAAYPYCQKMRRLPGFYCALKLFDPWFYGNHDVVVLLDSDILFFRRPDELLECVARSKACFNSDYQSSYAVAAEELKLVLGIEAPARFNAGLLTLARRDYDLKLIENYFANFSSIQTDPNRHEQTAYAVLSSRCGAQRLSPHYQISTSPIGPETISHHFVNDGSRLAFSTRGVKTLRQRGFLTQSTHLPG